MESRRKRWNMKHRRQTSEAGTASKGKGKDRNKKYSVKAERMDDAGNTSRTRCSQLPYCFLLVSGLGMRWREAITIPDYCK